MGGRMNAIQLLKDQHKKTKATLEKGSKGKLSQAESKKAADELVAHMVIEEHVFYPRIRELKADLVSESYEEHTTARFSLARCLNAKTDEEIKARVTVLKELIEHHVEEEEEEMFPKVEKGIDAEELELLGTKMEAMFQQAVELGLDALVSGLERNLKSPKQLANGVSRGATANPRAVATR
jgi:iron-sulfur cluster repair protein YtfE (RIC family)